MNLQRHIFPLAERLGLAVADDIAAFEAGLPAPILTRVTPTTAELLRYWFAPEYRDSRQVNFHRGQRDAILHIIYAHEVLACTSLRDLFQHLAPTAPEAGPEAGGRQPGSQHPLYAAKMATGTGKTWVLSALLVWQYLNAAASPEDVRFTRNFLIVTPGLIVYDRMLDAFLGPRITPPPPAPHGPATRGHGAAARLGTTTPSTGQRDFSGSDLYRFRDLFVPDGSRTAVFSFVRGNVVTKEDIGVRTTGSGVIAITNWHLLAGKRDPGMLDEAYADTTEAAENDENDATSTARTAALAIVPLTPGTATGNDLDALDRRAQRGRAMRWLAELPSLLVFNDEAHHARSAPAGQRGTITGEAAAGEVEWHKSLTRLATPLGRRFMRVDFSATPYTPTGRGRKDRAYFPHIVVDCDLLDAMNQGLVKSIVLDTRREVLALGEHPLDFRAERDEHGRVSSLSAGQRVMLRAGLSKLDILDRQFADAGPTKHPKLLVVVENTEVSPLVEDYLLECGLAPDDVLRVDSGRKAELGEAQWAHLRDRLDAIDTQPHPRVIISVLMLREGFDVNNICVIVPLRSSASDILLEQTIGRGLRLMWRGDPTLDELKRDTRERMHAHREPTNYHDVLFVVEHPRYADFYRNELGDGLVAQVGDTEVTARGDAITVERRPDYANFDVAVPIILHTADERLRPPTITVGELPLSPYLLDDLLSLAGRHETFVSQDIQEGTQFGEYRVDAGGSPTRGYNDYLADVTARVTGTKNRSFTRDGLLRRHPAPRPVLPLYRPLVARVADNYIRTRMFGRDFDPRAGDAWRALLPEAVTNNLVGTLTAALLSALHTETVGEAEVRHRRISEVVSITARSSSAIPVTKSVYPLLPVPSRGGGLERLFIEWADADGAVEALVKVHEHRHDFLRRPYLTAQHVPAHYSPDFLVRTAECVYVVETKASSALSDDNVRRKADAARAWCHQLNELPAHHRDHRSWHYVILDEESVRSWHSGGGRASDLLAHARLVPPQVGAPGRLF
ncbi:hypothetical protein GCM10022198_03400 [Klugiella xanthotipulae]|uniref:Type III restriction enzyme n=1 Tax=Klugiella xanthotipulae TaxID=244735 RepID=A0A543I6Y7_9MICO|nr:DEAD/DEAH box helicase family protein [Klugiella xanthotipulae]TQM66364.1 type III restriction enzyme [Klugiella xanthotipulae]